MTHNPILALANHLDTASARVDALNREAMAGGYIPRHLLQSAVDTEDSARQALSIAIGHPVGSPEFDQAAEGRAPAPTTERLLIETANAILETLETCAPISAKPNNPGWKAMNRLHRCHRKIAGLLTRPETETTA